MDVLGAAEPGATFLLNSPFAADQVWDHLPRKVQQQIVEKKLKFYVIDGYSVAREAGMGSRINTIMQTCFFAISGVLPREEAIAAIKQRDPENLRQARRSRGAEKFRRRGCLHRSSARSDSAARGEQPLRYSAAGAGDRSGIRSRRSRRNDFRQRRFASGKRPAAGRHVSHRHGDDGKSETSRSRFPSGTKTSAFSAENACWSARTP